MSKNNVKTADYVGDDALDKILTDLTKEASELLEILFWRVPSEDWLVVDIHTVGDNYQAVVRDERSGYITTFDIDDEYPVIRFALHQDLLQRSALIHSLHPNHHGQGSTDNIRLCLSEGVRTPGSEVRGFRWDLDSAYIRDMEQSMEEEDIEALAAELADKVQDEVKWLKADTETIKVVVKRVVIAEYPFDHYPFLGAAILRCENKKLTGMLLDFLNAAIERRNLPERDAA